MNASSPRSVSDGELYSATVSDFSGSDPLIYKEPLRTEQSDSKHLNCECHSAITPYSDDDATSETEKNFVTGIFLWPLERTKVAREESFAFFLTLSPSLSLFLTPFSLCIHDSAGFCARTLGRGVRLLLLPRAGRRVHQLWKGNVSGEYSLRGPD